MKRIGPLMAQHVRQHVFGLYQILGPDDGVLEGTGLYLDLGGEPYVLTAHHVFRGAPALAVFGGQGKPFFPLTNAAQGVSPPQDLGLTRLDGSASTRIAGLHPLSAGKLASSISAEGDFLYIYGYPGMHSRFFSAVGGIASQALSYVTTLAELPAGFDERVNFAISYPAGGNQDDKDREVPLPSPDGLSGSPIWATRWNRATGATWKPETAEVIGVTTRWLQDEGCLIGTRIEVVRPQVRHFLQREAAYFRWKNRGCPENDSLTDWLSVENAVSQLI